MATTRHRLAAAPPTAPLGGPGFSPNMTRMGDGRVVVRDYLNPEWSYPALYRTSDQMYRTDPVVRAAVMMVVLPVIEATWNITPASPDPQDHAAAEFVRRALLEELDWPDLLWQLLAPAMRYGHSVVEEVWKTVEWSLSIPADDDAGGENVIAKRPYWVPAAFVSRPGWSIHGWRFDDLGNLSEIVQLIGPVKTTDLVTIPGDRLVALFNEREGQDDLGRPLLRSMYRPWYAKEKLEIIDLLRAEKAGVGVPIGRVGTAVSDEDLAALEQQLQGFTVNEQGYILLNGQQSEGAQEMSVEMLDMRANSTADVLSSLRYHVEMILWSVMGAWQNLGQGEVGARATAEAQDDPFYLALRHIADRVASAFSRQHIPRLVALNFPGARPPLVSASNIQGADYKDLLKGIAALLQWGGITHDDELESYLREILGLPPRTPTDEEPDPADPADQGPPVDDTPSPPGVKPDQGAPGREPSTQPDQPALAASGSTSLSLGARDETWDSAAAKKALAPADYPRAAFWRDPEGDPTTLAAYKLWFASPSGGLHAVWAGVTAVAAVLQGSRGGVDIPEGDVPGVKRRVEGYYAKARAKYGDDSIEVPWAASTARRKASIARLCTDIARLAGTSYDEAAPIVLAAGDVAPSRAFVELIAQGVVDHPLVSVAEAEEILTRKPRRWSREPTMLEAQHVSLAEIDAVIDAQRIRFQRTLSDHVHGIARRLADRALPDDVEEGLRTDIRSSLQAIVDFGRSSVRHEVASQKGKAPAALTMSGADLEKWLTRQARRAASAIVTRLEQAADRLRSRQHVPSHAQTLVGLTTEADRALRAEAVATVGQAFQAGRYDESASLGDEGWGAVYSSVLDQNTCIPCDDLDGTEYTVGDDDYERDYPPLFDCEGGDACRCMMVLVSPTEGTG